jgi:hypothetical protein
MAQDQKGETRAPHAAAPRREEDLTRSATRSE